MLKNALISPYMRQIFCNNKPKVTFHFSFKVSFKVKDLNVTVP